MKTSYCAACATLSAWRPIFWRSSWPQLLTRPPGWAWPQQRSLRKCLKRLEPANCSACLESLWDAYMSDQKPKEPPESRTEGSRVGGDVKIEGPGTFVGRDQYVGLKVEELVAALRQAFPTGDTRPERLGQLLDEFRAYHAKLYEWKELHNALNKIIDAFDQYAGRVESSYIEKNPLKPSLYRDAWRPVNRNVDDMLDWAQTIQYIGQRYQALANDRLEGERWAVDIKAKRDDLRSEE